MATDTLSEAPPEAAHDKVGEFPFSDVEKATGIPLQTEQASKTPDTTAGAITGEFNTADIRAELERQAKSQAPAPFPGEKGKPIIEPPLPPKS